MAANPYGWRFQLGCPCCEEVVLVCSVGNLFDNTTGELVSISDGTKEVGLNHEANLLAVKVDSSGFIYVGGSKTSGTAAEPNITTRKMQRNGLAVDTIWSVDHGLGVQGIAVNGSGEVFTTGARSSLLTSGNTSRKYDSAGNLLWSKDDSPSAGSSSFACHDCALDASGNILIVCAPSTLASPLVHLIKRDTDGTLVWTADDHGAELYGVATDAEDNVYVVGRVELNTGNQNSGAIFDSSGNLLLRLKPTSAGDPETAIAVGPDGHVYIGAAGGVEKWEVDLVGGTSSHVWSSDKTYIAVNKIVVGEDNSVYFTCSHNLATNDKSLVKLDSDGNEVWSYTAGTSRFGIDLQPGAIPVFR